MNDIEKELIKHTGRLAKVKCGDSSCDGYRFYYTGQVSINEWIKETNSFSLSGERLIAGTLVPSCQKCKLNYMLTIDEFEEINL